MLPLILHGHAGPNPWKVALVLEELSLPYSMKIWDSADQKKEPFITTLNANGLTPVIEDPNTNIKLWESGAIIEYLLETYDTKDIISFPVSDSLNRGLLRQYHYFQATSQGPSLSAALYFTRTAPNPAARSRYVQETIRVLGVLENELKPDASQDVKEWLVGGKCTVADLAFMPYMLMSMNFILGADKPDIAKEFPNVQAWTQRLNSRPSVKKVLADRAAIFAGFSGTAVAK